MIIIRGLGLELRLGGGYSSIDIYISRSIAIDWFIAIVYVALLSRKSCHGARTQCMAAVPNALTAVPIELAFGGRFRPNHSLPTINCVCMARPRIPIWS